DAFFPPVRGQPEHVRLGRPDLEGHGNRGTQTHGRAIITRLRYHALVVRPREGWMPGPLRPLRSLSLLIGVASLLAGAPRLAAAAAESDGPTVCVPPCAEGTTCVGGACV